MHWQKPGSIRTLVTRIKFRRSNFSVCQHDVEESHEDKWNPRLSFGYRKSWCHRGKREVSFISSKRIQHSQSRQPEAFPQVTLSIATKAVKDNSGPSGLVPTLLVFGKMPRIPIRLLHMTDQVARMNAMVSARLEMSKLATWSRLKTALHRNVPTAADNNLTVGDEVLMYRKNRIGKWSGPYLIEDMKDKTVTLNTCDRLILVSVDMIKRYEQKAAPLPEHANPVGDLQTANFHDESERLNGNINQINATTYD